MSGLANINDEFELGGGAQFWVYLSPQNNTKNVVKDWSVTLTQGKWSGTITSKNPTQQLKTPNLSGIFKIKITQLSHSTNPPRSVDIPALPPSTNEIGCNSNCASMVGIIADKEPKIGGATAKFWTTWDAICRQS